MENDTHHHLYWPHTAQQNGRAKRKHRHTIETCLSFFSTLVPLTSFWVDTFSIATYIISHLPLESAWSKDSILATFSCITQLCYFLGLWISCFLVPTSLLSTETFPNECPLDLSWIWFSIQRLPFSWSNNKPNLYHLSHYIWRKCFPFQWYPTLNQLSNNDTHKLWWVAHRLHTFRDTTATVVLIKSWETTTSNHSNSHLATNW